MLIDIQNKHAELKTRLIKLFDNKNNYKKLSDKYKNRLTSGDSDEK